MRTSDYPFVSDWFAISLRWLCLLGFVCSLGLNNSFDLPVGLVLVGMVLWNGGMTVLAAFNRRLLVHRVANLGVDLAASLLLFVLTGGINGPLLWAGVLPLFSAAIYFEITGSILIAFAIAGFQVFYGVITLGPNAASLLAQADVIRPFVVLTAVDLGSGALLALMSRQLMKRLRQNYQNQVAKRRDAERRIQESERTRLQTMYQMIETLSATLNYRTVLDTVLDLSVEALAAQDSSAREMAAAVLLFKDHDLTVASSRRMASTDQRCVFPADSGALQAAIQKGEPLLLKDPAQDPELVQMVAMQHLKMALLLPMNRGMNCYGLLLFAHASSIFFNAERVEALEMISHQATIAIQNARLFQDIQEEKNRIVETQDEARKKLARDLHDGPTQSVSAIAMRINIARTMIDRQMPGVPDELARIEELARRTTQEIRHMLFTLRPLVLESEGLQAALRAMAGKMKDTFGQNVSIEVDPTVIEKLEIGKQTVIFYLAEEAVNNARKHAKASLIKVSLRYVPKEDSYALLEIADNGVGFDVEQVNYAYEKRGSLGMVNLRERTDLISGLLHIDSAPGKGTRVQIVIPLTEEAADRLERNRAVMTS